jgi:hypothetical protein
MPCLPCRRDSPVSRCELHLRHLRRPASRRTRHFAAALPAGCCGAPSARTAIAQHGAAVTPAWTALKADADKALALERFSVVDKTTTPPSGDKHDYMTQAPYWWPDPKKPDGLPYIRRDGERNPELDRLPDHGAMDRMASAVTTLALAAYLGDDDHYAAKAVQLLRAWFIDPATRMNPASPMPSSFRESIPDAASGLIETRPYAGSGRHRTAGGQGIVVVSVTRTPFEIGLHTSGTWMRESPYGRDESNAKNNHGTYYDLQVAIYALSRRPASDRETSPRRSAREADRCADRADGRQPLELARTRSFSYSVMNIDGLTQLATVGDRVGVDLWNYTRKGSTTPAVREALLYLAPYALGDTKWPHSRSAAGIESLFPVLRRAAVALSGCGVPESHRTSSCRRAANRSRLGIALMRSSRELAKGITTKERSERR